MSYKNISVETKDLITSITLNRPEFLNAFTLELIEEFLEALSLARLDDSRVIIIRGAGRAFCAGGDLHAMKNKTGMFAGDEKELKRLYKEGIQQIPQLIEKIEKPIIAMINGPAVGAGCDLACMCDLRFMSDKAIMKDSFINLALVSGDGGAYFLHRIIGYAKTMELLLSGRKVDSKEALKIGLVNQVFEADKLEDETYNFARKLCSLPFNALKMNKRGVKDAYDSSLEDHLELMATLQAKTQRSEEHFDLVNQFLSK